MRDVVHGIVHLIVGVCSFLCVCLFMLCERGMICVLCVCFAVFMSLCVRFMCVSLCSMSFCRYLGVLSFCLGSLSLLGVCVTAFLFARIVRNHVLCGCLCLCVLSVSVCVVLIDIPTSLKRLDQIHVPVALWEASLIIRHLRPISSRTYEQPNSTYILRYIISPVIRVYHARLVFEVV